MSRIEALPFYHGATGRLRGVYVYMVIFRDEQPEVYVKVGASHSPGERLRAWRRQCAAVPWELATVELPNRRLAFRVETALHHALRPWRVGSEWYCVSTDDRLRFNRTWRSVLASHERPSWPLDWQRIPLSS